jgi:uncharacterized coiled-coil DUF342 family protein
MIEWIIIGGIVVTMYIVINKYEKKMEDMHKLIEENKKNIDSNHNKIQDNHTRIDTNHGRLDEHYNHIEKLWVASPIDRKKNVKKEEE